MLSSEEHAPSADSTGATSTGSTRVDAPDGEPKLVFTNGRFRGRAFSVTGGRTRIGRKGDNDIVIDVGLTVSADHAVISYDAEDDTYWIEDCHSKNGTFLNEMPVERAELNDGDTICFSRNGPEARFTTGTPEMPGLIEMTLTTLRKTRSVRQAMGELLPASWSRSEYAGISGVERLLDDRLEKITRRSRWFVVSSLAGMLLLATVAVVAIIVSALPGRDGARADPPRVAVELQPKIEPIYGSLSFDARDHAIGHVTILNREKAPLRGLSLSFEFFKDAADYLVEPFVTDVADLGPGDSTRIAILPKFSSKMRVPRTQEVTAVFRLIRDGDVIKERVQSVFIHGSNVFNWEDPRRIATFIDPQDSGVKAFVRDVLGVRDSGGPQDFPPKLFREAVNIVTALTSLRLRYVTDPVQPTSEKIDPAASDQVNFPWQTLLNRTGDCDDLSVLCAAIFEAAGIPAAIAVGPRHLLVLFDSGIPAALLDSTPLDPATVVSWEDRVWVPIETTLLGRSGASFTNVWSAAWQWREEILAGELEIVPVREAWREFAPAPVRQDLDQQSLNRLAATRWVNEISHARQVEEALSTLRRLFQQNLQKKVKQIEEREAAAPARQRAIGLLHARSGFFDRAREMFTAAIFGEKVAVDVLADALDHVAQGDEVPWLLLDLGICLSLGARNPTDLNLASRCFTAGVHRLPGGDDSLLRAEYLVRLALVHRLRGDLAGANSTAALAFRDNPALRETYDTMVRGAGPRAGTENGAQRKYLMNGLR